MIPGSFDVIIVDAEVLRGHVEEHGICSGYPVWRAIAQPASCRLRYELQRLFTMARLGETAMQLQCGFTELMGAVIEELFEQRRASSAHLVPAPTAADKIRECIHDDEPGLDLETVARATGLSRFQVVRSFKRRYGLPPQTYQLHLKIARAQKLLRRGYSPGEVAAACGFVDQSHLGRHFKRMVGLTPGEYTRWSSSAQGRIQGRWQPRIGIWIQLI
jgi:AraC-like DNA-binding protein